MKKALGLLTLLSGAFLFASCQQETTTTQQSSARSSTSSKPVVYVVNYPLQRFAERIGGDAIEVVFPAPSDEDPAFWQPSPKEVRGFQEADLILLNGAGYAKWTKVATLPDSKTVNTSEAFSDRYRTIEGATTHSHGAGGEHAHAGTDFNTWLDPNLAVRQAEAIRDAFMKLLPEKKETFNENFRSLKEDLLRLDKQFASIINDLQEEPLVASHPVYGYFADRYGLDIHPMVWEPETVPNQEEFETLKALLNEHPAEWIIWEGQPIQENVDKMKQLGLQSVVFSPCGNTPDKGDFFSVMEKNVEELRRIR